MNHITIELCAEDRARLDRLAAAMECRSCDNCVTTVLDYMKKFVSTETQPAECAANEEASEEAPNNTPAAVEDTPPITTPLTEENPTEETPVAPPTPTVDRAALRAKVIELSAKGLKEQTRDIVRSYAQTVTAVPDDKVAECYAKLMVLEA